MNHDMNENNNNNNNNNNQLSNNLNIQNNGLNNQGNTFNLNNNGLNNQGNTFNPNNNGLNNQGNAFNPNFNQQQPFNNYNQQQPNNNLTNNNFGQQQSYEKHNFNANNVKNNKIKYIIIAIVGVVILFGVVLLFGGKDGSGSKSGTTVNLGEELYIKNTFSDITFKVISVENNVKLTSILGALVNEEENFTKIKIEVTNHSDKDIDFAFNNILKLYDSNKSVSNGCKTKTWMELYESVTDAIDGNLSANSTTSGYIYCSDENNEGAILELTSITEYDEDKLEEGIIESTDSDKFYVKLK